MVSIISQNTVLSCISNQHDLVNLLKDPNLKAGENKITLSYDLNQEYPSINLCANVGYNAGRGTLTGLNISHKFEPEEIGVYCGTTYGGFFEGQKKQCDAFIKHGPRGVTPSLSIYNGIHLTSDIFAIKHNIRGTNLTNTTGYIASGIAMMQAFDDIEDNVLSDAIVIGTEQVDGLLIDILSCQGETSPDIYKTGSGALWLSNTSIKSETDSLFLKVVEIDSIPITQWDSKCCSQIIVKTLNKIFTSCKIKSRNIDCIITCNNFSKEEELGYDNAIKHFFKHPVEKYEMVKKLGHYMGANPAIAAACATLLLNQSDSNVKNVAIIATDPSGMCFSCVIGKGGHDYI